MLSWPQFSTNITDYFNKLYLAQITFMTYILVVQAIPIGTVVEDQQPTPDGKYISYRLNGKFRRL